jgi:CubicO group peptidase (beta-lactamase class C family)
MRGFATARLWIAAPAALALGACALLPGHRAKELAPNLTALGREYAVLRERLEIPGLAWAVIENGRVVGRGALGATRDAKLTPFTTETPLRFGSVTKALTATLALKLVEEGKLDLDAPAARYLPNRVQGDVRVWHLFTHTSEGIPGTEYVYSINRYALLGPVIAKAAGSSFAEALRERVTEPADMRWHDSPNLGAHAALVSSVEDMARYVRALDRGKLLDEAAQHRLTLPTQTREGRILPVSLGWFAQEVQGRTLMWSFGQDDPDHSGALIVRDPFAKRTLVLLANSNEISDPFRLLMGDVRKSPFAMSFFRNLLVSPAGTPRAKPHWDPGGLDAELAPLESDGAYRYVDEAVGEALLRLWKKDDKGAAALLAAVNARYGIFKESDPVLHFAALHLPAGEVKDALARMGDRLIDEHRDNRWILLTQGNLFQQAGRLDESIAFFETILALPNQHEDYLRTMFQAWAHQAIADALKNREPQKARQHLQAILSSEIGGEQRARAERTLEELRPTRNF